jgi:hypothetical protein
MTMSTEKLRAQVKAINDIPANEQCLGHFHVAVQDVLYGIVDQIERIDKEITKIVRAGEEVD